MKRRSKPIPARAWHVAAAFATALLCASPPSSARGAEPAADAAGQATLDEIVVAAPEPKYVAPTRRDRIGRVWAPVYINERGPFRLVLDTGASASAITQPIADVLGLVPDPQRKVRMFGVTGRADVAAVRAESLRVGDLEMESVLLPIVADAFGGAEGVLGNHGLRDKRITIDFRADRITIVRSKRERAGPGMITIPVKITERGLLVIPASVGGIQTLAIVDTGGQTTIGNAALRRELERLQRARDHRPDEVIGATLDVQAATLISTPPINLGGASVRNGRIVFGDMYIFDHWRMDRTPAMLIGMDVLGLLDVLVIDYRRRELQLRLRGASAADRYAAR
jgi:predicted aspartyl protease